MKQSYEQPTITNYGTMKELTHASGGSLCSSASTNDTANGGSCIIPDESVFGDRNSTMDAN